MTWLSKGYSFLLFTKGPAKLQLPVFKKKRKPKRSVYTASHLKSYLTEPLFIDLCGGRWY